MRISDWSSDVCSSDLEQRFHEVTDAASEAVVDRRRHGVGRCCRKTRQEPQQHDQRQDDAADAFDENRGALLEADQHIAHVRSEEHTSELQSLMRISYAVFCLKKKNNNTTYTNTQSTTRQATKRVH